MNSLPSQILERYASPYWTPYTNSNLSHNMHQDSQHFAKLKELQSRHTKPTVQFAAHLILPDRTQAHPPPQWQTLNNLTLTIEVNGV